MVKKGGGASHCKNGMEKTRKFGGGSKTRLVLSIPSKEVWVGGVPWQGVATKEGNQNNSAERPKTYHGEGKKTSPSS